VPDLPRLALCHLCHSLTRLPDPPKSAPLVPARWEWVDEDGKTKEYWFRDEGGQQMLVAQYDPALEDWVDRHGHQDVPESVHKHDLWAIDQLTWDTGRVMEMAKGSMKNATGEMYIERDELKDDAFNCFIQHHRPSTSCPDVFTEAKVIGNHESNRLMKDPNDKMYLCHLCPFVHGMVMPQARAVKLRRQERRERSRRR
jgi:hypothetical protein